MIKNIFSSLTKELKLKETEYFQIFLVILYVGIILFLIPVGIELLKSLAEIVVLIVYFIPYLIANHKRHPAERNIFWVDLLLSWTVIAWIILFVICVNYSKKKRN
jgi:uncharacterized membrane protein